MIQKKSQAFSKYEGPRDRAGSSDIWLLVLLIGLSVGVGGVIQCCGNRQEAERETRNIQFGARVRQIGRELSALEGKIGDTGGLSDEDREDILCRVRKLQKDYEGILTDFQRIGADERAVGESHVQQLWMLDRMGNQGR